MRADLILMLSSIFIGACGQIILKMAASSLQNIDLSLGNLPQTLFRIITNGWIPLGLVFFLTSMILWLKVISHMELSRAYPSVSLSYFVVFLFSVLFLKESLDTYKMLGLISICFGVFLIHR